MAEHIVSRSVYFAVFVVLMVLTIITIWAATIDISFHFKGGAVLNLNPAVALLIAGIKATCVILFFMHVRWSTRLTKVVVIAGLYWLGILLMTVGDYISRPLLTYPLE